ncbi:MAG: Flp family type IVb pilin [Alphaproteobacteria bacterium]
MRKTGIFLTRFWADPGGAVAPEYAILLAVIGTVSVLALGFLYTTLQGAMADAASCLDTNASGC